MYILSVNMWFQKLMKQFFFGIDQVVYNAISSIYDLLISIARTSVLSQADILDMADRIYKLLAIFMIFKVTLSLITYVVNPDDFSDKSKGISKLVTNIVISLGMLILTPYIFNMAYRLQTIILEDNTLATLIFDESENATEESGGDFINTAGDEIAFITMSAFFTPNTSITEFQNCIELTIEGGNVNPDCSGLKTDGTYEQDKTKTQTMAALSATNGGTFPMTALQNYVVGIENKNLGLMFRQEMAIATVNDNEDFVMDYKFIFSTVVGVVVALLLITFCMDVALRSIKLSFLQLIAPIPILSYVDPKSGKDGMFKKWYQLCFKTYLSLFIRLLALYFAIYIISRIDNMVDIVNGSTQVNLLVKIFIIIGALMFAKQLPKILEGLGIKLDGDGKFFLNPLKKFEEQAAGGKNVTGMARGTLTGIAGAATGAGIGRAFTGAWRGLTSGKGWKETGKAEAEMNRKMRQARLDGSTWSGRLGARFAGATGLRSHSENLAAERSQLDRRKRETDEQIKVHDDRIKNYQERQKTIAARKKQAKENANIPERMRVAKMVADNVGTTKSVAVERLANSKGAAGAKYNDLETKATTLKNNIGQYKNKDGAILSVTEYESLDKDKQKECEIITEEMATKASKEFNTYKDDGWVDFVDEVYYGTTSDDTLKTNIDAAIKYIATAEGKTEDDVKKELEANPNGIGIALKGKIGAAKGAITTLKAEENAIDNNYVADEQSLEKAIEAETLAKQEFDRTYREIAEQERDLSQREKIAKTDESAIK